MNSRSYYWSNIDFYTLTFLFYLHFTYTVYSMYHLLIFTIHYNTRFSFELQITSSLLRIETIVLMTRKAVSFEKVFHWTKFLAFESQTFFFTEMFHESIDKQFNWDFKIHCEINVKLIFHEILWKKNFTVYPSNI